MAVSISLSITQNSQSVTNNTSNVTVKVTAKCTYGSWNATGESTGTITIDGTKYSFSGIKFNTGAATNWSGVIMTKTVNVNHNDDGTKTLSCSASFVTGLSSSGTVKASGSKALTTIARASQPSLVTWPESTANVGNFGESFSIHMNRKSDVFIHTVRYEYGSRTGTIATGVTTGTTWAIPLEWMNDIPEDTVGSGRIYVDTYNGTTLIGTKYTGFTATVPASVKPTCTMTLEDTTGVDDIYGTPVKGLSKIKVTVAAQTAYGSPIASTVITANGVRYSGTTATTGVLTTAGTSPVTATVTDKRGRSGSVSYDMTVQDYTAPAISRLTVHRCDADGTENDQGEYCQVIFSAAVSSMSNKNTASYKLRHKKSTDTEWTETTISELANVYTPTDHVVIFTADGNSSYDVEVVATDRHGSVVRSTSVSTAFTLYNCHPDGTGWRFGGVAEKSNTLQNDLSFNQVGNSYAFQPGAFSGAKGYTCMAMITLTALNVNAPIVFTINRRGALCPMTVYARFASSSTTTDPDLGSFTYEGDNFGAFMVKTATATWKLYVDNTSGWSNPCLQDWYTTENQKARLNVTFPNEQVEGEAPSVLGTYYRAIPVVMQSIIDCLLPIGTIIHRYDHADPNTMYPGTTWERIENAFLWATTPGGTIGQTGGASTHTLTVDELPSHTHKMIRSKWYAKDGDGAISTAQSENVYGYTSGTTSKYLTSGTGNVDIQSAGGGQAHNNMPPYVQVSAWRRTA